VAIEIFKGNISEQATVFDRAKELADDYGVKNIIIAGDRGILKSGNIEQVNELGYNTITALTHPQICCLLENKTIEVELFDDLNIVEVIDPENPDVRYMLCRNNYTAEKERQTRESLLKKAQEKLEELKERKRKQSDERLCAAIGVIFAKYKVGKYFDWKVEDGILSYTLKEDVLAIDRSLDGCYVIRTDVRKDVLSKEEVVESYKRLSVVEDAFRNFKTVLLEIRPVYHHTDRRIISHVFICMLAYYLKFHLEKRLARLFTQDKSGKERLWTFSKVIEDLKSIRKQEVKIGEVKLHIRSSPDEEQKMLLDLLGVRL